MLRALLRLGFSGGIALGALCVLAPVASAADPLIEDLVRYHTEGFSIYLPAGWSHERRESPAPGLGTWSLASKDRSAKAYVRVGELRAEPIKALWLRFLEESLAKKYVRGIHLQSYHELAVHETTGVSFGMVYALARRNKTAQIYKFGVIAVRNATRKRMVYAAVGADAAQWPHIALHLPLILRSLDLAGGGATR